MKGVFKGKQEDGCNKDSGGRPAWMRKAAGTGCRVLGLATEDLQAITGRNLTLSFSETETSGGF